MKTITILFILGMIFPSSIDIEELEVKEQNNTVKMSWALEEEHNAAYFKIERSLYNDDYEQIAKVSATAHKNKYEFVDEEPILGDAYYRIAIYNKDGECQHTNAYHLYVGKGDEVGELVKVRW